MRSARIVFAAFALLASCRERGSPPAPQPASQSRRALSGAPVDFDSDVVLGQADFLSYGPNFVDREGLYSPAAVLHDAARKRLYVSDWANNRVLGWDNVAAFPPGRPADFVLGGINSNIIDEFRASDCVRASPQSLCGPRGLAVDDAGNLFVADQGHHRVLAFLWPVSDGVPDRVLGQKGSYDTGTCNKGSVGPDTLCSPADLAAHGGALFVADAGNNRILRFADPLGDPSAQAAFGQQGLDCAGVNGRDGSHFGDLEYAQLTIAVDRSTTPNRLYVVDSANSRVLAWSDSSAAFHAPPQRVIGQSNTCAVQCNAGGRSETSLCLPASAAVDQATGDLYVVDAGNGRVLVYRQPFQKPPGPIAADLVLLASDFGTRGPMDWLEAPRGVAVSPRGEVAITFGSSVRLFAPPITNGMAATSSLSGGAVGLAYPTGVAFDGAGRLFVADSDNNRVLSYLPPAPGSYLWDPNPESDLLFGQATLATRLPGSGDRSLSQPRNIAVLPNGEIWISDMYNFRVLGYRPGSDPQADVSLGSDGPTVSGPRTQMSSAGWVDYDSAGAILVADNERRRIGSYLAPIAAPTDQVDRVLGQPDLTSVTLVRVHAGGLSNPQGVAVDSSASPPALYVADTGNHRLLTVPDAMAFASGVSARTDKVFGQPNATEGQCSDSVLDSNLCSPSSLAVDTYGNLYSVDVERSRVLEYDRPLASASAGAGDTLADRVYGSAALDRLGSGADMSGNCLATTATGLCFKTSAGIGRLGAVALDGSGALLTVDAANNRVLAFEQPLQDLPGTLPTADRVLGQLTLYGRQPNHVDRAGLFQPRAVAVDTTVHPYRLYVADGNHRVLGWGDISRFDNGAPADVVVGQPDFESYTCPTTASTDRFCNPAALAVDPSGDLYVAELGFRRVMRFAKPFDPSSPKSATRVLGGGTCGSGISASRTCEPLGLAVDSTGFLWVSDRTYNRVLGFAPGQSSATLVIGQADFSSVQANRGSFATMGPATLNQPVAISLDPAGRLWIADSYNARVVRYPSPRDPAAVALGADYALMAKDLTSSDYLGISHSSYRPEHVAATAQRVFVTSANSGHGSDWDSTSYSASEYLNQPIWQQPVNRSIPTSYSWGGDVYGGDSIGAVVDARSVAIPGSVAVDPAGSLFLVDRFAHRVLVHWANRPPLAVGAAVLPAAPRVGGSLTAEYGFQDSDGDAEQGSVLQWFRNGAHQPSFDGLRTFALPAGSVKGDRWHFTVKPSDGTYAGSPLTSPEVQVVNSPPSAVDVRVSAPSRQAGITGTWRFSDPDGDAPGTPVLRWYLNGAFSGYESATVPGSALSRDQRWKLAVTPFDGADYGEPAWSDEVVVLNSPPTAASAIIAPAQPTSSDALVAHVELADADGDPATGEIVWYRDGVEALRGVDLVPTSLTAWKESWQFGVTPYDGRDRGAELRSNIVQIGSTSPAVTSLTLTPAAPHSSDALAAAYVYASIDGKPDQSRLRWFRDQQPQPDLDGARSVPAARLKRGELWYFTVEPFDGELAGIIQTSRSVVIANTAPTATSVRIEPAVARAGDELVARFDYADLDGDPDASTVIWYLKGEEHSRGAKVAGTAVRKGDLWTVKVLTHDGAAAGPELTSAPLTIANTPPAATDLRVEPSAPRVGEGLRARWAFEDRDGDADRSTQIVWTRNGTRVAALDGAVVVPAGQIVKQESWAFSLTPFDGTDAGAVVSAPAVAVLNTAPVATGLRLQPMSPMADEPLAAFYDFFDADGDRDVSTEIVWLRLGLEYARGPSIPAGVVRRGETWSFRVLPGDGTDTGAAVELPPVTIGNRPPSASNPRVLPGQPTRETPLSAVYDYADPDSDPETNSAVSWYRDGLPYATGRRSIAASELAKAQRWRFEVTPSDGQASGAKVSSPEIAVLNTPPVANAGPDQQLSPTTATAEVMLDGQQSSDVDGDLLEMSWSEGGQLLALGATPEVELAVGRHVLTVTVSDGEAQAQDEVVVVVRDEQPVVSAEPESLAVPPGRVALRASAVDPLGRPMTYLWTQVSGDPVVLEAADALEARFFAVSAGERVFEVVASTGTTEASAQVRVRTEDVAPFAAAGGMYYVRPGTPVALDGSQSVDPNGAALTFRWTAAAGALVQADQAIAGFTANEDGAYPIQLIVDDGALQSAPALATVVVVDPAAEHAPVAAAGLDRTANAGEPVQLDAGGSYDLDGDALQFRWTQVSGPAAAFDALAAAPALTLPGPGEYQFSLVVSDGALTSAEDRVRVSIVDPALARNRRPVVRVGPDPVVAVGTVVTLDASESRDPEGIPPRFRWEQVWGCPVTLAGAATAKPSFDALRPGLLRFQVVVGDGKLEAEPAFVSVRVTADGNRVPLANAGPDRDALLGSEISFDATGSSDPDAAPAPLRYAWHQVLGPPLILSDWSAARPVSTPTARGEYRLALTAFDGQVPSAGDEVVLRVATHGSDNRPPIASASAPLQVQVGEPVEADGSGSRDPDELDNAVLSYRWELVGLPSGDAPELDGATSVHARFVPDRAGDYTLRLVVSDGELASAPTYLSVRVGDVADDRCGCGSAGAGVGSGALLVILVLAVCRRRARIPGTSARAAGLLLLVALSSGCGERVAPERPGVASIRSALTPMPLDEVPDWFLGQVGSATFGPNLVDAQGVREPAAVAVDPRQGHPYLYVADGWNNRVLAWRDYAAAQAGAPADAVIGQTDLFASACASASRVSVCEPTALAVDEQGNLFVGSARHWRVLMFERPLETDAMADRVFGQADYLARSTSPVAEGAIARPAGLAVGGGFLYVGDSERNRVLRFDLSEPVSLGTIQRAKGVLGQASFTAFDVGSGTAGLNGPRGLALDLSATPHALYVADFGNSRVLRFDGPETLKIGAAATDVLGQRTATDAPWFAGRQCNGLCIDNYYSIDCAAASARVMCYPSGVAISGGRVWVADASNSRVLGFPVGASTADRLLGQSAFNLSFCNPGGAPSASSLCLSDLAASVYAPQARGALGGAPDGSLFVVDGYNTRVLGYRPSQGLVIPDRAAASSVLGQSRYTSVDLNSLDGRSLNAPSAVAFDRSVKPNRLYIADTANNRVLGWADDTRRLDGLAADLVLGQPDFLSSAAKSGEAGLNGPRGLAVDDWGNLYVADSGNNRILFFAKPFENGSGARASRVYGQADFAAVACNRGSPTPVADGLCGPRSLALDPAGGLYAADYSNFRVLYFPVGQMSPARVFGRASANDFTSLTSVCSGGPISATTLCYPVGLAVDAAGRLYVGDGGRKGVAGPNRVLVFTEPHASIMASSAIGVPDLQSAAGLGDAFAAGVLDVATSGESLVVLDRAVTISGFRATYIASPAVRPEFTASFNLNTYRNLEPVGAIGVSSAGNLLVVDATAGDAFSRSDAGNRAMLYLANTLPAALSPKIVPSAPIGGEALTVDYIFSDADGDAAGTPLVRWFLDGTQTAFTGSTLPGSATTKGQRWSFELRPFDGKEYGTWARSPEVVIGNRPPTATASISPAAPSNRDTLTATWTFSDLDLGDADAGPRIEWLKDNVHQLALDGSATVPPLLLGREQTWTVRITPFDGADYGAPATASVKIVNGPPAATDVLLAPAAPTSSDSLTASWTYSDPDGDAQALTRVRWTRNGQPVPAWDDKARVTERLVAGDRWRFSVEPGDGILWGARVFSNEVLVETTTPSVTVPVITPAFPTSAQGLTASYVFTTLDGKPDLSERQWLRDGVPVAGLTSGPVPAGTLKRGEGWAFQVRPYDGFKYGETQTSATVYAGNSAPSISAAAVSPASPRGGDALTAVFTFADYDGDPNRSRVVWYRDGVEASRERGVPAGTVKHFERWYFTVQASDGTADGNQLTAAAVQVANTPPAASALVVLPASPRKTTPLRASYSFDDPDGDADFGSEVVWLRDGSPSTLTGPQVATGELSKGQTWAFTVRPKDGGDFGLLQLSPQVTILNSPPEVANLRLQPAAPVGDEALTALFDWSDADGDPSSNQTVVRWYRNGLDTGFTGTSVPANTARRGDRWAFRVLPHDGEEFGAQAALPEVVIGNRPPVATNARVEPAAPTNSDTLEARYDFSDPDTDPELGSEISWFLDGVVQPALLNRRSIAAGPGLDLHKGQHWHFQVRPKDGYAFGAPLSSAPVEIVNRAPVADAGQDQLISPREPMTTVRLDASGTRDPDGDRLTFDWYEAGALLKSGQQVDVALDVRRHTITLRVSDGPATDQDDVVVDIADPRPVVRLDPALSAPPGHVSLAGVYPFAADDLGRALTYTWTQLSGDPIDLMGADTLTPWFFALRAGDRVFQFVAHGTQDSASASTTVSVSNVAPFAGAFPRVVVRPGEAARLDGTASSDPNGDALAYRWTLVRPVSGATLTAETEEQASLRPEVEGRFDVELVVSDGELDSAPAAVEVIAVDPDGANHAPVAVAGPDLFVDYGEPVVLDGWRSYDLEDEPLTYAWRTLSAPEGVEVRLGESGATASFVPAAVGRYRFALKVSDGERSSGEDWVTVEVTDPVINGRPEAVASGPLTARVGERIALDASGSFDPELDELRYAWTQTAGAAVSLEPDAASAKVELTALRPGLLELEVVVTDPAGLSSSPARVAIAVTEGENRQPHAEAGAQPAAPVIGTEVVLDGSASSDPDGDALSWRWRQTEGPLVPLSGWDDARARFTPPAVGRYAFVLVVSDAQTPSAPAEVAVVAGTHDARNQRPIAVASAPATVQQGQTVQLDGSRSTDPDPLDRLRYRWSVVSFPTGSEPVLAGPTEAAATFVPNAPGDYAVQLVVGDGDLWSEPAHVQISVPSGAAAGEPATCGCGAAPGSLVGGLAAAVGLLALRRRRATGRAAP